MAAEMEVEVREWDAFGEDSVLEIGGGGEDVGLLVVAMMRVW